MSGPTVGAEGAAALDPAALYHLATETEWERYRATGRIEPASLDTEGFVHCSWGRQVPGTVAKHFAGVSGLLALRLDPDLLGAGPLVEEDTSGAGQAFPHVYGPIDAAAVVEARPVA